MLIFYDPKIYKVGGKNFRTNVIINRKEDIDEINKLQLINANETIYPYRMDSSYLNNLNKNLNSFRLENTSKVLDSELTVNPNGKLSKLVKASRPKITYGINLKFFSINKKISEKYLDQKLFRDVKLVELHKEFCGKVENNEYQPSEWGLFLENKFS